MNPFKQNQFGGAARRTDHQEQALHLRRLPGHAYRLDRGADPKSWIRRVLYDPDAGDGHMAISPACSAGRSEPMLWGVRFFRANLSIRRARASAKWPTGTRSVSGQHNSREPVRSGGERRLWRCTPPPNQPITPGNYPQNNYFVNTPGALDYRSGRWPRRLPTQRERQLVRKHQLV